MATAAIPSPSQVGLIREELSAALAQGLIAAQLASPGAPTSEAPPPSARTIDEKLNATRTANGGATVGSPPPKKGESRWRPEQDSGRGPLTEASALLGRASYAARSPMPSLALPLPWTRPYPSLTLPAPRPQAPQAALARQYSSLAETYAPTLTRRTFASLPPPQADHLPIFPPPTLPPPIPRAILHGRVSLPLPSAAMRHPLPSGRRTCATPSRSMAASSAPQSSQGASTRLPRGSTGARPPPAPDPSRELDVRALLCAPCLSALLAGRWRRSSTLPAATRPRAHRSCRRSSRSCSAAAAASQPCTRRARSRWAERTAPGSSLASNRHLAASRGERSRRGARQLAKARLTP